MEEKAIEIKKERINNKSRTQNKKYSKRNNYITNNKYNKYNRNNKKNINNRNIVLIGMPAVGKSTLGKRLAKELKYEFIDSDKVIEETENRKLSTIIKDEGIDGFIDIEGRINAQINTKRSIIATGGSAVYSDKAMRHFKKIGTVVYLKQNIKNIKKRIKDPKKRGVALKEGQTLDDIYNERIVLYEKYADIVVDQKNYQKGKTLSILIHKINKYNQRKESNKNFKPHKKYKNYKNYKTNGKNKTNNYQKCKENVTKPKTNATVSNKEIY